MFLKSDLKIESLPDQHSAIGHATAVNVVCRGQIEIAMQRTVQTNQMFRESKALKQKIPVGC